MPARQHLGIMAQHRVEEKTLALLNKKVQPVTDLITTDEVVIKSLNKKHFRKLQG